MGTMQVLGLFSALLSTLIISSLAQPVFIPEPVTSALLTTAGGLVLTGAAGSVVTIPTNALLLGKGLLLKKLLIKKALLARELLSEKTIIIIEFGRGTVEVTDIRY